MMGRKPLLTFHNPQPVFQTCLSLTCSGKLDYEQHVGVQCCGIATEELKLKVFNVSDERQTLEYVTSSFVQIDWSL